MVSTNRSVVIDTMAMSAIVNSSRWGAPTVIHDGSKEVHSMSESIDATGRSGVPDLLGVPEAAALLRVGLTFAYESTARFIATGSDDEIPAIKVGRPADL